MATQTEDGRYILDPNEYSQLSQNSIANKNKEKADELAQKYGVPISYSSQEELDNQAQGLGMAESLYGEKIGNVGSDAAFYRDLVKGNLNKDYAGADSLRQQTSAQVAKASANAGLAGVNNLAMQNQLYRQGAMQANTLNQDYKDKATAAFGRNISARQSGQSSLVTSYKGLGTASTPSPVANYDSGSIICTELYRQGKITKGTWIRTGIYGLSVHPNTYFGYLTIATPVVELMKKSDKFSNLFIGWAKSIAKQRPNLFTRIMIPLCWSIGYVRKITKKETFRIA